MVECSLSNQNGLTIALFLVLAEVSDMAECSLSYQYGITIVLFLVLVLRHYAIMLNCLAPLTGLLS